MDILFHFGHAADRTEATDISLVPRTHIFEHIGPNTIAISQMITPIIITTITDRTVLLEIDHFPNRISVLFFIISAYIRSFYS